MRTRATLSRPHAEVSRPKNRLLARLPPEDFARLQPHLTTISTKVRQVFHKRGDPIRQVFFPNGGVASVTAAMHDGEMIEVATVGDEGMVGVNAFFGGDSANVETLMQVPDTSAEMMDVEAFQQEMKDAAHFSTSSGPTAMVSWA